MGLFSSKTENKITKDPAGFVQPGLSNSVGNYADLALPEAYGGDWQAQLNPMLSGAWNNMYNDPTGQGFMQQSGQAGSMGLNAMGQGMDAMGQGNAFQFDQNLFDQSMGNLMPGLQGSYDAATRDIGRNLNWNTLPGLDMGNIGAGQQGGTALGKQSALATGMAQDRASDIGAGLYQNAINQSSQNAMKAGAGNQSAQNNIIGQYGNMANMGLNAMGQGFNMNQGMLNNQLQAGTGQQGYSQQGNDMNRAHFDQQQTLPWIYEGKRLSNLTNPGSAFGTTTNEQSSDPGLGNIGLQLGSAWLGGGGGNPFSGIMGGGGGGQPSGSLYDGSFMPTNLF